MLNVIRLFAAVVMALSFSSAMAQRGGGFDTGNLFLGAGISQNDLPGTDEETGWQFFGGYEFGEVARGVKLDAEVGYMNAGDFGGEDVTGLWATGVGRLSLNPQFELLGRLGFDFGDDDGLMVGVGAGFSLDRQNSLRLEFVERDNLSSVEFNFVYRL